MYNCDYVMGGWWIIFPIFGILMMIFFMFRVFSRRVYWSNLRESWCKGSNSQYSETALDILKKRYAQGEISKEEFDQIKEDL